MLPEPSILLRYTLYSANPRFTAYFTSSVCDFKPSFFIRLPRCISTVRGLSESFSAMCGALSPSAAS